MNVLLTDYFDGLFPLFDFPLNGMLAILRAKYHNISSWLAMAAPGEVSLFSVQGFRGGLI